MDGKKYDLSDIVSYAFLTGFTTFLFSVGGVLKIENNAQEDVLRERKQLGNKAVEYLDARLDNFPKKQGIHELSAKDFLKLSKDLKSKFNHTRLSDKVSLAIGTQSLQTPDFKQSNDFEIKIGTIADDHITSPFVPFRNTPIHVVR